MKKFIALLVAAVLIVSMAGVMTASAGASISGNSDVLKGKSYKYTAKVTCTGLDMVAKIEGLGQSATLKDDSGNDANGSLSASTSITVSIPSGAQPGDKFTITLTGQYSYLDGDTMKKATISESKTIKVVAASAATPKPATSRPAASSNHSQAPATPTPEPTGWTLAAIDVAAMAQGGRYEMPAPEGATVPGPVLSSLREQQGVLSVDFGSYSCTIDGASLGAMPEDFAGIDLGLTMEKDPALSAAAGGADAYQLHFKHEGALPGRFTFRFKAEQSSPGDTVYLYYYYGASGVVEGKQACVVDDEGYISVEIYHCSDYFLSKALIEGASGILVQPQPEQTAEVQPLESDPAAPVATPAVQAQEQPGRNNLGVSAMSPLEQWFGMPYAPLIAAVAAAALLSMLLTMLLTHSGLFKRRSRVGVDDIFASDDKDKPRYDKG